MQTPSNFFAHKLMFLCSLPFKSCFSLCQSGEVGCSRSCECLLPPPLPPRSSNTPTWLMLPGLMKGGGNGLVYRQHWRKSSSWVAYFIVPGLCLFLLDFLPVGLYSVHLVYLKSKWGFPPSSPFNMGGAPHLGFKSKVKWGGASSCCGSNWLGLGWINQSCSSCLFPAPLKLLPSCPCCLLPGAAVALALFSPGHGASCGPCLAMQ